MRIFDENGRYIGDLHDDNQQTSSGCGLGLLGVLILAGLSCIVAFFSKWWGGTGYWIGFLLAFALYTVVFFYVYNRQEGIEDIEDFGKAFLIWLCLSILVIGAFDFMTSWVTGVDCYLILGGFGAE